jgi:hypothetical protein
LTEELLNATGVPMVGAPGNVVTDVDGLDDGPIPVELVEVIVNVYDVLDVNPLTIIGESKLIPDDAVKPPGLLVTIKFVIPIPMLILSVEKPTLTELESITLTAPMVGGSDNVVIVLEYELEYDIDDGDVPLELVAVA